MVWDTPKTLAHPPGWILGPSMEVKQKSNIWRNKRVNYLFRPVGGPEMLKILCYCLENMGREPRATAIISRLDTAIICRLDTAIILRL